MRTLLRTMEQINSYMRDCRKVSDFLAFLINFLKVIIKDCFILYIFLYKYY